MSDTPSDRSSLKLGPWHLATSAAIAIDQARLSALQAAEDGILAMLSFEDRYAMIIDNLMDLERHLFNWSLIDMLRPMQGFDELFDHKRDANRFLGNLLSACRQYIDQTHHHIGPYLVGTALTTQSAFSEQYDAHLSYRVMEALRNYVQHEDLGVHTVSIGGSWIENRTLRRYTVSMALDLDHLSKATRFKKSVFDELKEPSALPDLKQIIREYVSGLSTAHKKISDTLKPQVVTWVADTQRAFADVEAAHPDEKINGLAVFSEDETGFRTPLLEISREPSARLARLQRSNKTTLNLGPAFASAEALETTSA